MKKKETIYIECNYRCTNGASQERLKCKGVSGSKKKEEEMGDRNWDGRELGWEGVGMGGSWDGRELGWRELGLKIHSTEVD